MLLMPETEVDVVTPEVGVATPETMLLICLLLALTNH